MGKVDFSQVEKSNAIQQEVEASFKFIIEGIRILKTKKSAILNNHVELQLFAGGFERLAKILLFLKYKQINSKYPELRDNKNFFSNYDNGHGIKKMIDELVLYSKTIEFMNSIPMVAEDINFLENDHSFNKFMEILSDFSRCQRYYYVDVIAKKENKGTNAFEEFSKLIYSYSDNIDVSKMSYEEEDKHQIDSFIKTIEKGVRAISRFFTHGFGNEGQRYYGDFVEFIFMKDEDLGDNKYLKPKLDPQHDYKPWRTNKLHFLKIKAFAKTKIVKSDEFEDWAFTVDKVKVYNYKNGVYCFVKIGKSIFALNGSAGIVFKIPTYYASENLMPRKYQTELLGIAQKL
ncbi:MAG: hypothetical protein COW63_15780 [Bacteroidetes bacterium CG18_big_fil_WC_8_21_14_2_50_41_14]|nr:MAG: hypothetical protein COW63_15780 [Bacteroidetes bacterium CG18_big_fil_WC_8_21_14_2_50_41_14]